MSIFFGELATALNGKSFTKELNEIRIRKDKPIVAFVNGQPYYLSQKGLTTYKCEAITADKTMIDDIVFRASDCSVYSINEQIKQGFITIENGIRIGLAGDYIVENNKVKTINNFSSLNIRFPHSIKNASLFAFNEIFNNGDINNTLIISPPGAGKTTFLRDFAYQLSERNYCYNLLIVDERGEISGGQNSNINLGDFCDVVCFLKKKEAFLYGIRALNPNLILTDELGGQDDYDALVIALNSGVNVIATIHAKTLKEVQQKEEFKLLLEKKYFKRYVLLSSTNGPGTVEGIFDEKFNRILSPLC